MTPASSLSDGTSGQRMLIGEPASPGLGRGAAFLCGCGRVQRAACRTIDARDIAQEIRRLDDAMLEAEKELLALQRKVHESAGKHEAAIFDAQILLLRDVSLRAKAEAICLDKMVNMEAALEEALDTLLAAFSSLEDAYFRERAADLKDVARRVQDLLSEGPRSDLTVFPEGSVVVTPELLPSMTVQLEGRGVRAVIVEHGGQTAHATILARARGLPLLIQVAGATTRIRNGDPLIVDGLAGRVFIHPTPSVEKEYDRLEADLQAHQTALKGLIDQPCVTNDGVAIKLCANIGKSADAVAGAAVNAEGAGLYRTEFVFLVQDHLPSEEEQYRIYRATADHVKPRPVVIRALDIGSDKALPYFPLPREDNPSLGVRGIRLLLAHPQVLQAQLRAVLRLSASHPVSILFPMVGGMDELRAAKAEIERAKASLMADNLSFDPSIPVGAMIETPAAAIMARQLAREVDFLSVGTNDLVQYFLATDRSGSAATGYYEPLHPAILQVLSRMARAANAEATPVSICGEMAGNPMYTSLLLGLGYRSFSVNPRELLEIKNAIRSTSITQADHLARQVLALDTVDEIKRAIRENVMSSPLRGAVDIEEGIGEKKSQPLSLASTA